MKKDTPSPSSLPLLLAPLATLRAVDPAKPAVQVMQESKFSNSIHATPQFMIDRFSERCSEVFAICDGGEYGSYAQASTLDLLSGRAGGTDGMAHCWPITVTNWGKSKLEAVFVVGCQAHRLTLGPRHFIVATSAWRSIFPWCGMFPLNHSLAVERLIAGTRFRKEPAARAR